MGIEVAVQKGGTHAFCIQAVDGLKNCGKAAPSLTDGQAAIFLPLRRRGRSGAVEEIP